MAKIISKKDRLSRQNLSGWDKASEDAKKGIERLKAVISHCEEMKATGEPWPGESETR
jgi:hypothetical protein